MPNARRLAALLLATWLAACTSPASRPPAGGPEALGPGLADVATPPPAAVRAIAAALGFTPTDGAFQGAYELYYAPGSVACQVDAMAYELTGDLDGDGDELARGAGLVDPDPAIPGNEAVVDWLAEDAPAAGAGRDRFTLTDRTGGPPLRLEVDQAAETLWLDGVAVRTPASDAFELAGAPAGTADAVAARLAAEHAWTLPALVMGAGLLFAHLPGSVLSFELCNVRGCAVGLVPYGLQHAGGSQTHAYELLLALVRARRAG